MSSMIALLFALAFLMPRAINLHAFEHFSGDEDPISCEVCDIIVHTHHIDLSLDDLTSFEIIELQIPSLPVSVSTYETPLYKIATPTTVYNKPPPVA